ncbi:DUF456 domain-containing protein [Neomicrococcus aestuarii]|uniref:DUF456 domain-containing protein n=1 Tax=Neomicrococcus aestuarii TaxID=556325 RepID=A0A1L2ZQ94_9MICC|nr:DUF456 domain-containing protein [Neomicrococcus aestuarii]APF41172.1 hypothetical protein BHE16_09385 [Neomicrococcus aestuarii]MBB5513034.1 hypothetical protein [Neomicrococcus aestuarii]
MDTQIIVTIIAGLLLAVAALGTIYPVLPGSILAMGSLLAWAWILGSTPSWTMGIIGMALVAIGWSASAVLTGRNLKQQQIPSKSIVVAVVCGIVGMFVIPVVGLFVGFGVGLLGMEFARRKDFGLALRSAGSALKATGLGILVEFGMVALASSAWVIGVIWHFASR